MRTTLPAYLLLLDSNILINDYDHKVESSSLRSLLSPACYLYSQYIKIKFTASFVTVFEVLSFNMIRKAVSSQAIFETRIKKACDVEF